MDWKDALAGLRQDLPAGDTPDTGTADSAPATSKPTPLFDKRKVHVSVEKKGRGGKTATIAYGFDCDDETLQKIASELKRRLGVGGSARDGEILIQGNIPDKVLAILKSL
ncbi:MAG: translation initiation factor [Muribaculaceae bacterium]|nr:translation initiation factor [Muribaculaceae bacterium]